MALASIPLPPTASALCSLLSAPDRYSQPWKHVLTAESDPRQKKQWSNTRHNQALGAFGSRGDGRNNIVQEACTAACGWATKVALQGLCSDGRVEAIAERAPVPIANTSCKSARLASADRSSYRASGRAAAERAAYAPRTDGHVLRATGFRRTTTCICGSRISCCRSLIGCHLTARGVA